MTEEYKEPGLAQGHVFAGCRSDPRDREEKLELEWQQWRWLDFRCVLKEKLTKYTDRLDGGCERVQFWGFFLNENIHIY